MGPVLVWVTPVTAWDSLVMVSLEPSPPSSPLLPRNKKRKSQEWTTKELLTCCRNMNNTKHEFASCFMSSHSIRCIYFCFLLILYNQPSLKFSLIKKRQLHPKKKKKKKKFPQKKKKKKKKKKS